MSASRLLNEHERLLADRLLRGAAEGVILVSAEGLVELANPAAGCILGSTPEELVGSDLFGGPWRPSFPTGLPFPRDELPTPDRLQAGETFGTLEIALERPDGRSVVLHVDSEPFACDTGTAGAVYYLQDVTARVQAENDLEAAEESIRRFMERSPDAIVIHRQGRIVYANPAVARFLGFPGPDALVGTSILDMTYPDDRPLIADRVRRMITESETVPLEEERFLQADGGVFTAEVFALPIYFDRKMCILAYGHDLEPRQRGEAERSRLLAEQTRLREEAQHRAAELKGILDNLMSGLFVCEPSGRVTLTNRAAARILGRSSPEELYRDIREIATSVDLRRPDGKPYLPDAIPATRALAGETVVLEDLLVYHAPTRHDRTLRTSAAPIRDEHGRVVAAVEVFRDVTELVEFDRLKDQFIRVVAHELKTPLTILKGFADVLLDTPEDQPPSRSALQAIGRGAARIDRIVGEMLELSQLLVGGLELEQRPLELAAILEKAAAQTQAASPKHRLVVQAEPVRVRGDPARIAQVVSRLLDNAVRYSPRGGEVRVSLRKDERWALMSVQDQGVGIPEQKQARVFQRFYRAHTDTPHDYGGLGVGLFISREIVLRHGGDIWFESLEDVGSTFHLRLPLEAADEP